MLTIYSIIDWVSAITIASFAALLFLANKKPSTRASVSLSLAAALWAFGVGYFYYEPSPELIPFWVAFTHFSGVYIAVSFYYFARLLHTNDAPSARKSGIIALSLIALAYLYFASGLLVNEVSVSAFDVLDRTWTYGWPVYIHYAYLIGFFAAGFIAMKRKFDFTPRDEESGHMLNIYRGSILGLVPALVVVVGLRAFGITHLFWLGPILVLIWLTTASYSLLRYHVLNVKVFVAEVLVLAMTITLFSNIFMPEHVFDIPSRILVFGAFAIIGILFLSAITKADAHRKELVILNAKLRHITDDLAATNFRLKERNEQKSYFISFASHQLQAPLTALTGYASMIADGSLGKVTKKAQKAAEAILVSGRRLSDTVNDFLDVSRIELGKMSYAMVPLDLAELIESITSENRPKSDAVGIELRYHTPRFPLPVNADKNKLRHAIGNIIDNAIKYTPSGSITISADKTVDGRTAVITVTDTGIGMDEETLSSLFERFRRTDITGATIGSGLGLYLAREIARAHGGDITASSKGHEKGSTFTIKLPISA